MGIDRTVRYLYGLPDDGDDSKTFVETNDRNVKNEAQTTDGPEHYVHHLPTCFCGRGVL